MATQQTKIRAGSTARKNQRAAAVEETLPLTARLRAVGRGFSALMPDLVVSDRLRREITAGVLLTATILSAWVLGTPDADGRLVAWWGRTLDAVCGQGAFLAPLLFFAIAFRAFRSQTGPILLPRHYLGGAAFPLAILGLFELAGEHAVDGDGGRLGLAVATLLRGALGELGAGLALLVAGVFAVFLLADTDLLTYYRDLRALWPKREADDVEELAEEPVVVAALPAKTVRPVKEDAPPPAPVINLPKAEPKPAPATATLPKIAPVAPGEPMPLPQIDRLAYYEGVSLDTNDLEGKARLIEQTLASFKVEARVREINPGPAVTQYTLEPGVGIKVRRITELQNDLALALAAPSIRIEAPVPGMARVGIEIPNAQVATVGLRETLESPQFARSKAKLPVPLGRDVNGKYVIHDLTKMPHLLIAGATGAGKSVGLNAIISTFLLTRGPDELKMLMIDPKMVELTGYTGVPHLQCPVVTEMDKVVGALRLVVQEMQRRYDVFSKSAVRNLDGYRLKIADEPAAERIPYMVVILDELADLMMTSPDEVETLLCRLTQMGRAAGIHLIIATQRPSVDVLTGLIKANVPARIAFARSRRHALHAAGRGETAADPGGVRRG
jgi:S-DNA-T family DNA segregation ATPase FtsK/SpoIIIE